MPEHCSAALDGLPLPLGPGGSHFTKEAREVSEATPSHSFCDVPSTTHSKIAKKKFLKRTKKDAFYDTAHSTRDE